MGSKGRVAVGQASQGNHLCGLFVRAVCESVCMNIPHAVILPIHGFVAADVGTVVEHTQVPYGA